MWGRLLKMAGTLKLSNPPQSLLHQIGLAGGTRCVNPNAGRVKGRQAAAWEVKRHKYVSLIVWLFFPQWVFLATAVAPLFMFSGGSPEHNFRKLENEEVHLLGFTCKTFEHEL